MTFDHTPLPRGMALLGAAGVLPFAAALAGALASPVHAGIAATIFIGYGAVILSFLGGARWGRGLADAGTSPWRYVEAVLPSLLGFAVLLMAHRAGVAIALLAAGFTAWLVIDLRDARWSRAYRRMRLAISAVVLALHAGWWIAL